LTDCADVVGHPIRRQTQHDGRIPHWGRVLDRGGGRVRVLRVVTLDDGDIDRALRRLDLTTLETGALPSRSTRAA